jgi:D-xylose transport system permease protein
MSTHPQAATAAPELGPRRSPLEFLRRVMRGDVASVRVIVAIAVIWIVFQLQNNRFLSAVNLTNLVLQITATGLISVGVVYVLLLGEIDLSVGAVSGVTSALMAVLNVQHGWNPYVAIAAAVAMGIGIGVLQGALFSGFGIPSFVVTLAGLLAWEGLQLYILGDTGTINVTDGKIVGLANHFYSDTVGWVMAAVAIGVYAGITLLSLRSRRAAGLADTAAAGPLARIAIAAAGVIGVVAVLNSDRGVPLALLILVAFVAGMQYVATRTLFGRHVFAVGGNAEAARRAGIRVNRIRIVVFGISGAMAAIGGILAASRLLAVNQASGGSDLLLFAIAGPVIAGTSLFGGRGSVWSALLGAIVIGSISNGMDLLALQSSVKFMVTGGVLVVAVIVDALARRNRQARA